MRIILLILFTLVSFNIIGQKQFYCIYRDTTRLLENDSLQNGVRLNMAERGLPPQVIDQLMIQLLNDSYKKQNRIVIAKPDCTIIYFERSSIEGSLNGNNQIDSFLLKNGEIYLEEKGIFSQSPLSNPGRIYHPTGNKKKILDYNCFEYFSTDSTVRVWLCPELPSNINPGVRVGKLSGAILAYESYIVPFNIKSEIIRLERVGE